jgi:hypothetical protein
MEERVQELSILRQDRPDNDTFASSQTYHVDQFGRITLDLVSHISIARRPKNETRGRVWASKCPLLSVNRSSALASASAPFASKSQA